MEWRDITDPRIMPGRYKVSDEGQVMNLGRNRLASTFLDNCGYVRVHFMTPDHKDISERVHRIVAATFLGQPKAYQIHVDHIDGDKTNNRASNLRWCTRLENIHNPITFERHKEGCHSAAQIAKRKVICEDTNEVFTSMTEAAVHFNISLASVSQSCRKYEEGKPRRLAKFGKPVMHFHFLPVEQIEIKEDSDETLCRSMSKSNSKPVRCIETDKIYPSVSAAARAFGMKQSSITGSCKRRSLNEKQFKSSGTKICYHFEWVC